MPKASNPITQTRRMANVTADFMIANLRNLKEQVRSGADTANTVAMLRAEMERLETFTSSLAPSLLEAPGEESEESEES